MGRRSPRVLTSGVIDVSSILGAGSYLLVDQAHYLINALNPRGFSNPNELVEGGQLMMMRIPLPVALDQDQCDDRGWQAVFKRDGTPFRNEGECIRYVRHNNRDDDRDETKHEDRDDGDTHDGNDRGR